ncbi:putative mitochondrial ornithine carrier protein AmcA/Ort1 [Protomyces lactucae-debilis]|uniref:Putative mitochondrial ornithine carrier protein AmcA/Ort1 n=1 Tax=Protomyces lactucae-debilis TaxID=2754530 RepID=A0A1Y2FZ03_PROLT|nr:putative mitochondrial ornithine carrier protein AmcA/Ort1 [Protomyces lactucae-debilis]ORY87885.1 putative mitochondrial ornithine carrier protein AmcA/Ort1 [Protomyces lactucae-debilis]
MADGTPAPQSALKQIAFGSVSGVVGKLFEYPFDTVKVRLQSQTAQSQQYTSTLDCFRRTVKSDGYRGLYRGLSAPLWGAMVENAMLFVAFAKAQELVRTVRGQDAAPVGETRVVDIMLAGSMSGAATSFVLTPVELVKCRLQVQTSQSPMALPKAATATGSRRMHTAAMQQPGVFALISQIHKTDGLRGFWRGQVSTLCRESGGSLCWFSIYELMLRSLRPSGTTKQMNSQTDMLMSGAAAGVGYNTLFFPFDTIKSRMQTSQARTSFADVVKEVYARNGMRGYFKGWGVTVCRAAPSNALIFWVYETLCKHYM